MWDRMLVKIWNSVSPRSSSGAQRITEVIGRLLAVDPEVKKAVATAYIQRCAVNYGIAFSQWRLYFRENECRHDFNQSNLSIELECK